MADWAKGMHIYKCNYVDYAYPTICGPIVT